MPTYIADLARTVDKTDSGKEGETRSKVTESVSTRQTGTTC